MGKDRYKFIVQVILGNQKGQGVQAGCKNFWDTDTDAMSFEQYIDDNLFCLVTVWAVYVYWLKNEIGWLKIKERDWKIFKVILIVCFLFE